MVSMHMILCSILSTQNRKNVHTNFEFDFTLKFKKENKVICKVDSNLSFRDAAKKFKNVIRENRIIIGKHKAFCSCSI